MNNRFTKILCLLFCLVCFGANGQKENTLLTTDEKEETPVAETGTIKGHLLTTDNKPATEVTVTIKAINRYAITNENGNFVLKNVKVGNYIISIFMVGLQQIDKEVTVATGHTVELSYTLQETSKQLEEVIVTAHKSPNEKTVSSGKIDINPMELPQSIAVVGQALIRDQQALRLSDVIKNVNGVYLATTRGNSQEAFSARGYGFSSSNMFKNGARVNAGAMPEMSSLEKVEVLKGSAAILYGNVAPGGIVNMVTKQPKFNFGGEVFMRAGSYDLYKPSFDVYGSVTAGIAYRLNGTFESAKSFRNSVHSKRYYVNPSMLFKLGKRTELLVQADYLNHEFTPDFGIGSINNSTIAPLPRGTFLGTIWSYATTKQTTASAALKHAFNDSWKLNFNGSYQNYSRDYYSTERVQADATGKWARPLNRTFTNEDYFVGQLDLTGKFKTASIAHTLLAGVDADRYYTTNYTYNQPTI
jgi:iron complex outermembrane receptor protein